MIFTWTVWPVDPNQNQYPQVILTVWKHNLNSASAASEAAGNLGKEIQNHAFKKPVDHQYSCDN